MIAEYKTSLDKKIERFREIQERSENNPLIALALGEASLRRGLRLEALTAYQDVLSEHSVPEAYMAIARIYADQGMITEAYEELERLFAVDPRNIEARILGEELNEEQPAPESLLEFLVRPPYVEAVLEARRRLKLEKRILERELQELTRNVAIEPDEAIHEYLMEEAKKRLSRHESTILKIAKLEDIAQKTLVAPPIPSSGLVTPEDVDGEVGDGSSDGEQEFSSIPGLGPEESEGDEIEMAAPMLGEATNPEIEEAALTSSDDFEVESTAEEASGFEALPAGFASEDPLPIGEMFFSEDPLALSDLPLPKVNFGGELPPIPDSEEARELVTEIEFPGDEDEVSAEEEQTDTVVAEPEEAPEVEEFAATEADSVEPVELEPEAPPEPAGSSPERKAFYEEVSAQLSDLTAALSKTRGVTSTFLVSSFGEVLEHSKDPEIDIARIGETVLEGLDFLTAFAENPQYWVLECNGGIFVMQTVDAGHVLVAIGQAGANFGALRYTMDKTKSKFADILVDAPE